MVHYFDGPEAWRRWLRRHHAAEKELWVGFHKRATGKPSLTWPQSVDEALCFGWIDGVRYRVDDQRYKIRFTPRKATSKWSLINIERVAELRQAGRMAEAGEKVFAARKRAASNYSYEQPKPSALSAEQLARFQESKKGWRWFQSQAPWYQRTAAHWVVSAKKEETRERRLAILIRDSSAGRNIPPLNRPSGK